MNRNHTAILLIACLLTAGDGVGLHPPDSGNDMLLGLVRDQRLAVAVQVGPVGYVTG